jgi:multidrug efflux system outer membrane protein
MRTIASVPILRHIRKLAQVGRAARAIPASKRRAVFAVLALALTPGLSGCILGSERPELNLDIPPAYHEASKGAPDAAVPMLDWWRGFRSHELTELMDAAQIYNLDIAVAIAQIVQADAQVGIAGAPLLPSVSGNASAEQQHVGSTSASSAIGGGTGGGSSTFSTFSTGLTASYILDFWGKNRATLAASEENATASRYNREVVTLTTMATVANTYFTVLAAQDQIRVTRQDLAAAAPLRSSTCRSRKRWSPPSAPQFRRCKSR